MPDCVSGIRTDVDTSASILPMCAALHFNEPRTDSTIRPLQQTPYRLRAVPRPNGCDRASEPANGSLAGETGSSDV